MGMAPSLSHSPSLDCQAGQGPSFHHSEGHSAPWNTTEIKGEIRERCLLTSPPTYLAVMGKGERDITLG